MERSPVTREELDSHLSAIDERIAHSTERSDIKFNAIVDKLETMSNQTAKVLDIVVNDITDLKEHKAKTNAYWKITGASLLIVVPLVLGLAFDRLSTSQLSNQPQQSIAHKEIRQ